MYTKLLHSHKLRYYNNEPEVGVSNEYHLKSVHLCFSLILKIIYL